MFVGKVPTQKQYRALEVALILQMEHGFNPSTFTARTVSSTLPILYAAVGAAAGALSGPLHGGASSLAMKMLEEAQAYPSPALYVKNILECGGKIMGMGHRAYKTVDPRAVILHDVLERLGTVDRKDYMLLCEIEKEARKIFESQHKLVHVNVDFWSGSLYKCLGLKPYAFPAVFAAARVVGWCAHILELRQKNKVYRPHALYVGPTQVPFVPIQDRKDPVVAFLAR